MQDVEAIILAGGLGTRLRSAVADVPKPMAPVAGRPFLEIILTQLARQGLSRAVLSVGYKSDMIVSHFGQQWGGIALRYCIEDQPLGTGGAIAEALKLIDGDRALVLNGDTLLDENFAQLNDCYNRNDAAFAMFVRQIEDGGRYGVCELDGERLNGFQSGDEGTPAWINAGSYLIDTRITQEQSHAAPYSFEAEVIPRLASEGQAFVVRTSAKFIDIGIPESYRFAQSFIPTISL